MKINNPITPASCLKPESWRHKCVEWLLVLAAIIAFSATGAWLDSRQTALENQELKAANEKLKKTERGTCIYSHNNVHIEWSGCTILRNDLARL